LMLPLIRPPVHDHRPVTIRALYGQVRLWPASSSSFPLRGFPALPADDEAGTVVTARALAITARDSDTRSPRYRGLKRGESVLTGESLPAEKLPGPFRLARRWPS
jgi:hypothetical protein